MTASCSPMRCSAARVGPDRDLLVQVGAGGLEQPAVRGVADEHVVEAVDRLVAPVGAGRLDQLLAPHRLEQRRECDAGACELAERAEVELRADDRRELEHRALVAGEPFDAGREQRLDRRRNLHRVGVDRELPLVAIAGG